MKKKIFMSLFAVALSTGAFAQNMFDALRYSQNYYAGTARFTSMGGAFSALGGDMSSLSVNPAGVGVYRSWEFTITPSVSFSKTLSSYEDTKDVSDSYTRFGFTNMGYVIPVFENGKDHGLVNFNLAVGYNKLNNFNSNTTAVANATSKSMANSIINQANAKNQESFDYYNADILTNKPYDPEFFNVNDWPVIEAWNASLIDNPAGGPDNVFVPFAALGIQKQLLQTETRGSLGEYVFSMGGNVSHKFYFGLTVGFQDVMYEMNSYYEEKISTSSDLNSFGYNRYYNTDGFGVNVKFGAIYRPISDLRLAFAVHTPTWYNMSDSYDSGMWTKYNTPDDEGDTEYYSTPPNRNVFDYRINTPYKLIGGAAYTFQTYGLISLDYEFVDYSTMKLKDDSYAGDSFSDQNRLIGSTFKGASNIRIGAEGNVGGGFAIRAGYGYYGSPYKGDDFGDNFTSVYSVGAGYRFNGGFVDFGYSMTNYDSQYAVEDHISEGMIVDTKNKFNQFLLTLGLKF